MDNKPDILDLLADGVTWEELLSRRLVSDKEYSMATRNLRGDKPKGTTKPKTAVAATPVVPVAPKPFVPPEEPKPVGVQFRYLIITCACCKVELEMLSQKLAKFSRRGIVEYKPFAAWTPELTMLLHSTQVERVNVPLTVEACLACTFAKEYMPL